MHVSDGYRAVEVFSCTSVSQSYLSISGNRNSLPQFSVSLVLIQELHNFRAKGILIFFTEFFKIFCIYIVISQFQSILDIHLVGTVKYRSSDIESQSLCRKTQVDLQHLSDIHTGRHAQRIQHNVQRTAVRQEGHIFYRKHTGNNTLVSMTAGHLITYRDLSLLGNVDTHCFIYAWRKLISIFPCEYFGIYYDTIFSVRNLQRGISYFSCLLTEDSTEQTLLCCKLSFSLRSNLTYQDISRTDFRADTDDTSFIQIFQGIVTYAWNVPCDLFRSQFGVSGLCFIFFYMNRCIYIIHNQSFA